MTMKKQVGDDNYQPSVEILSQFAEATGLSMS